MKKKMWVKRIMSMLLSSAMLMTSAGNIAFAGTGDYATITIEANPGTEITEAGGQITLTATVIGATDTSVTWTADNSNVETVANGNTLTVTGKSNGTTNIMAMSNEDTLAIDMVTITVSGQPNVVADYGLNVLFIGNSITKHPPKPGWDGNWGMAASSENNDFVHRLVAKLENKYGIVEYKIAEGDSRGASCFEGLGENPTNDQMATQMAGMFTLIENEQPNIINVQIGENWGVSQETREKAFQYFIDEAKKIKEDIIINICAGFWSEKTGKDYLAKAAVVEANENVYLSETGIGTFDAKSEKAVNCAFEFFEEHGIGAHPGDVGMENIAQIIYDTISPVIDEKFEAAYVAIPESITLSEGQQITTDAGTLEMIPQILPEGAGNAVIWSVDNENIATISEDGVLTAKNNGEVIVRVKSKYDDTVEGKATVTIQNQSPRYTVTYSAGTTAGVTNLPAADEYAKGTYTLSEEAPKRELYQFAGWSLTEGGAIVDEIEVSADTTVYAIWRLAYEWTFNKRMDGIEVVNGFNVALANNNLMMVATGMNYESSPLTVVSPKLSLSTEDFNVFKVAMRNGVIDADTNIVLTVTTTDGEWTYEKQVLSTLRTEYSFDISDCTGTITGFTLKPTTIDAAINIDNMKFDWASPEKQAGYYSADLFGGAYYDCNVASTGNFNKTVDTEVYHEGGSSLKIYDTDYGYNWMTATADVKNNELYGGEALTFSTWLKKDAGTTLVGKDVTQLCVIFEYKYLDASGVEQSGSKWVRDMTFPIADTTDWQYVSGNFVLPVPEGCRFTSLTAMMRLRDGDAGALSGAMWFDQIELKRSMPGGSIITEKLDESCSLGYADGYLGYPDAEITQEEVHDGSYAYKFTGEGYKLFEHTWAVNTKVPSNQQKLKTSFWLKVSQAWLDYVDSSSSAPFDGVRVWLTIKYKGLDGQVYQADGTMPQIAIKNTTDWQLVECEETLNLEKMPEGGGEITDVYVMVRTRNGFEHTFISDTAIYADSFEVMLPQDESLVTTELVKIDKVYDGDKKGVRMLFNDSLITECSMGKAAISVNGTVCNDYELIVHDDAKTVDIYPAANESIKSFTFNNLVSSWGYDIRTENTKDGVNGDKFLANILPAVYENCEGSIWNGYYQIPFKYEIDKDETGNESVKILPNVSSIEIFSYTIPAETAEGLTENVKLSFDSKLSEDAKFVTGKGADGVLYTEDDVAEDINRFRIFQEVIYVAADGTTKSIEMSTGNYIYYPTDVDCTKWQNLSAEFAVKYDTSKVPDDAKEIVGLRIHIRPNNGGYLPIQGNIWLDNIRLNRILVSGYYQNLCGDSYYECDSTYTGYTNWGGFKNSVIDTEVYHDGGASVKTQITTEDDTAYNLVNKTVYNVPTTAEDQKFIMTMWVKKSENAKVDSLYIRAADVRWDGASNNCNAKINGTDGGNYALKGTTEWQRVVMPFTVNCAGKQSDKIDLMNIYVGLNFGGGSGQLAIGDAIWVDQIEFYNIPETAIYTRIENQTANAAGSKIASVDVEFNSEYVSMSALQAAEILLDGKAAAYAVTQSADKKTATFTFKEAKAFETFKIANLLDIWGNSVVTTDEITMPEAAKEVTASVVFTCHDAFADTWDATYCNISTLAAFGAQFYDKYRAEVTVQNDTAEEATVDVIAVRKEGGNIVSITSIAEGITVPAGETSEPDLSLEFANDLTADSEVTVYIWDSLETMKPVIPATSMAK